MIRILGTIFAGLLGLAFGSFLNVCLSRWPEGESIVHPRSHCRNCDHTLAWWENIPLLSWFFLWGRCRGCHTAISWRYPLVELAVGVLWATNAWRLFDTLGEGVTVPSFFIHDALAQSIGGMIFFWILVALAALDAEHQWLPDLLTLPGTALGFAFACFTPLLRNLVPMEPHKFSIGLEIELQIPHELFGILAAALLILLIRWLYKLIRHREGIGLGDAKLMALLAAWLGFPGALLAFFIGVLLGALAGVVVLIRRPPQTDSAGWSATKLPLGTFLCIGGIVSALWGQPIIAIYIRWAGF